VQDLQSRQVTLPDGKVIMAEVVTNPVDMMRGMMFRESLAQDRGMLFVHGSEGEFAYWMYQVKVPLDIIWINRAHRVVEISANTPPCPSSSAQQCPNFGGHAKAIYVLELAAGSAAKHGIKVGETLSF
jgi:uncharacterized membrane protein (UPF0127 family)